MSMADHEETSPEEKFTFVDKRRVADSTDSAQETQSADEGPPVFDTSASSPDDTTDQATDIYQIVAYCVGLLITEGFQRLGLLADPQTGKAVQDLPSARVAIDSVAALTQIVDEPGSTLPDPVRREMKRTLNDLRLNYIDRNRS